MTTGLFRNLVLARAIAVDAIARAVCADLMDAETTSFARKSDRWRAAARRAAQSTGARVVHEPAVDADDPDWP